MWRGELPSSCSNAYPYASGHVLVMPLRHTASLVDLTDAESAELWWATQTSVAAIEAAYEPDGLNMGANLGRAAGAGLPAHVHLHVLPRWAGDTNFMTSVAETRVMPETLQLSWKRLSRRLAPVANPPSTAPPTPAVSASTPMPTPMPRSHRPRRPTARPRTSLRRRGWRIGAVPAHSAAGVAGHPDRDRLRPRGRRAVGAVIEAFRARRFQLDLQELRLVVGRAGGRGRGRLVRLLHRYAVRAPPRRSPAPALATAVQAVLRVAGHHQFAAGGERGRLRLRLSLVPPFRRRQHARRVGVGRNARRRLGQPVPGRHPGTRRGGQRGRVARPGTGPDRDVRDHARHRLALRLRAPLARGGVGHAAGFGQADPAAAVGTRRHRSSGSWPG